MRVNFPAAVRAPHSLFLSFSLSFLYIAKRFYNPFLSYIFRRVKLCVIAHTTPTPYGKSSFASYPVGHPELNPPAHTLHRPVVIRLASHSRQQIPSPVDHPSMALACSLLLTLLYSSYGSPLAVYHPQHPVHREMHGSWFSHAHTNAFDLVLVYMAARCQPHVNRENYFCAATTPSTNPLPLLMLMMSTLVKRLILCGIQSPFSSSLNCNRIYYYVLCVFALLLIAFRRFFCFFFCFMPRT